MWLGARGWAPVLDQTIPSLPDAAGIQNGSLFWPERSGRLLGANQFLSLEVLLNDTRRETSSADVSVEAHPGHVIFRSVLGAIKVRYPALVNVRLDRAAIAPAWGAWRAPILVSLIPATALALMLVWSLLALPYAVFVLALGQLVRRDLTFRSSWKLSVAAQLPGSLLMTFAIALYASGEVSVLFIVVMLVAHFIPTLLYLLISPFLTPKQAAPVPAGKNPFGGKSDAKSRARNPFAGSES